MPRNFSELKSGGTIPMLSPHPEKWGDASPPSPTDRRMCIRGKETTVFSVEIQIITRRNDLMG